MLDKKGNNIIYIVLRVKIEKVSIKNPIRCTRILKQGL
jgi:hypothetical protein